MAGLFERYGSGRPFGEINNPFEGGLRTRPPRRASPRPAANNWRASFGPNPFHPANRGKNFRRAAAATTTTRRAGPAAPGGGLFPPHLVPGTAPFSDSQRGASGVWPPGPPDMPLGQNGVAGTAPAPNTPFLAVLGAALAPVLASLAGLLASLLAAARDIALFLCHVTLPAGLRLVLALARCVVFALVACFLGNVLLRVSLALLRFWAELLRFSLEYSGLWPWSEYARAYVLRPAVTGWSVTRAGVEAVACNCNSWRTTDLVAVSSSDVAHDKLTNWNVSLVWNVSITTVTTVLLYFVAPQPY